MSWHLIPKKLSCWNVVCFGQKAPVKVQFFTLSSALMKVYRIPHASFETTSLSFIQILHYCSVSSKITPVYFCGSNLYTLDKERNENIFQTFEWLGENSSNSSYRIWNHHHSNHNLCITLQCHGNSSIFFNWNFIWFGQKEPIKVQNFRSSTGHMKFHQICILIGPFCYPFLSSFL